MGRVLTEADLTAGWLSFKTKQVEQLTQMLRKSTAQNAFSKARAATNLKQLGSELREQSQSFQAASPQSVELQSQVMFNDVAVKQAEDLLARQSTEGEKSDVKDNRFAINEFYKGQGLQNSRNVVNSLGGNFDSPQIVQEADSEKGKSDFDASGFQNKGLGDIVQKFEGRIVEQVDKEVAEAGKKMSAKTRNPDATKLGQAKLQENAKPSDAAMLEKKLDDLESQVSRYRSELESVQNARRAGGMGGPTQGQQLAAGSGSNNYWMAPPQGNTPSLPSLVPMPPNGAPMQGGTNFSYGGGGRPNVSSTPSNGPVINDNLFANGQPNGVDLGGFGDRKAPQNPAFEMPQSGFGTSPFGAWGGLGARSGGEGFPREYGSQAGEFAGGQIASARIDGTLASLDVEIPNRGQEFLFTTPGNELDLTARSFSKSLTQRLTDIAIAFGVPIGGWILIRLVRSLATHSTGMSLLIAGIAIAGILSLITGTFPVYGLLGLVIAAGLAISSWLRSTPARLLPEVK